MKIFFRRIHLYLSLAAGIVILIACLTGAILVFEKDLQMALNKKRYYVTAQGTHLPVERLLNNVNEKMPSELSGGMKKRVGIARAIVNNPKYLFCDEPNSGLDPQTSILIDELIQDITEDYDTTTVVVTHDMNSVMGIGENIMFIYKGEKLWEGNKNDVIHSGVKELDDFVFANKIMLGMKGR